MWNEAGAGAGGNTEWLGNSQVVHVGRSSFRMTTTAVAGAHGGGVAQPTTATETARILLERPTTPGVRIASSLFERRDLTGPSGRIVNKGGGMVTLSWRLIAVFATALLAIGAVASNMLMRPQPARVSAPPSPPPAPVRRSAPIVVESPIPRTTPPAAEVAATPAPVERATPVARTALETARRPRVVISKRKPASRAIETDVEPAAPWVDPFAE